LDHGHERVFVLSRVLVFQRLLNAVAGQLLVLIEHQLQLNDQWSIFLN
jgi:hypothetical protein